MPEFIVEILVVIEAPTPSEAEMYGEQIAGVIRQRSARSVKNAIVTDVRSEAQGDDE